MFSIALRGLISRKLRGILTALAVFFGVAMISGTLMLTDTVKNSFDNIFADANKGIDVSVTPKETVEDSRQAEPPAFSADLLQKVQSVDGVDEAAGSIFDPTGAILDEKGERIGVPGPPHFVASVDPDRFSPWTYIEGREPKNATEAAIDSKTADRDGYKVGDTLRVTASKSLKEYKISGIGQFGSGVDLLGASIAIFTLPEAQYLTNKEGKLDKIGIATKKGVSQEELKLAVKKVLPATVLVQTGKETADDESETFKEGFSFVSTSLLIFGGIALFVGAFLIFNTFSITVAQRTKEFGMLRTIGVSARQILATVLLESLIIGLAASILGILGGMGFVFLLIALFNAVGLALPSSGLVVTANTIIIALLVGVIATIVASIVPAIRATRVTPLEALREGGTEQSTGSQRRRTVIGLALVLVGVTAIVWGLFSSDSFGDALKLLGVGLVLLFIGVAMLSNRIIRPLATLVGWPLERIGGIAGQLARENTLRNPSRTATTAAALMIGVALITFVATFASAITKSTDQALDESFSGDLFLVNTDGFSRIPGSVSQFVNEIDGVSVVSPVAGGDARVKGISGTHRVNGIDPQTVTKVSIIKWKEGSNATLSKMAANDAIIEADWGDDHNVKVGDTLHMTTPIGKKVTYNVIGIVRDKASLLLNSTAIPITSIRQDFGIRDDDFAIASFAKNANFKTVRNRVDEVLKTRFPNVESRSQKELKADQRDQLNQIIMLFYIMLGLSVIISLFGVVNTLILTIYERTREIGMLRAIGASRRQVRRMIRYESIITAMIGAILGTTIGLVLAIAAVKALEDEGLVLAIPFPLLIVLLLLAGVAGIAAAIAPARRASKINVMEALHYE